MVADLAEVATEGVNTGASIPAGLHLLALVPLQLGLQASQPSVDASHLTAAVTLCSSLPPPTFLQSLCSSLAVSSSPRLLFTCSRPRSSTSRRDSRES